MKVMYLVQWVVVLSYLLGRMKKVNYKFDGRFNMGVVSLNLPQIGILARGSEERYFEILDKRLELAEKALLLRYNLFKGCSE